MPRGNANTENTSEPKVRRTPAEIAQAELDAAKTRLDKAKSRQERAEEALRKADADVTRAQRFYDFAAENPDLPANANGVEIVSSEDVPEPEYTNA